MEQVDNQNRTQRRSRSAAEAMVPAIKKSNQTAQKQESMKTVDEMKSQKEGKGLVGGDSVSIASHKKKSHRHHHEEIDHDSDHGDDETSDKRPDASESSPEYWQIQKMIKYLRIGNQTATIIAICALRDCDLHNEANQMAIKEMGGLEIMVNLLDTEDSRCIRGALYVLRDVSQNPFIRETLYKFDTIYPLVQLLDEPTEEIKCLAAETIAYCCKNALNRKLLRKYGGIKKLVKLLRSKNEMIAQSGAFALCSCSKNRKNREQIYRAEAVPLLAQLLHSNNEQLLVPVVGTLQECASSEIYRTAIREHGMIPLLVEHLTKSKNVELLTHCSNALFKCAQDPETKKLIEKNNGLTPLVSLLDQKGERGLLTAATGAIWKCGSDPANVEHLIKLGTIKKLVSLMDNQSEEVLTNIVGALGSCAETTEGRVGLKEANGIPHLVGLLTRTDPHLLQNVAKAIGACAKDQDCMAIIDRLDGVRFLWSLLKNPNTAVQASAAGAISPCIEFAKDAGEMVRSFVGGLELIVSLLKSEDVEVLANVCMAISKIANDEENLAVITDHGVVAMLAKLTCHKDDKLKKNLADAIAKCCHWGGNRVAFGAAKAVAPLVKFLKSSDVEVHRSTAVALYQLSLDPENCMTMHEYGAVPLLLDMVGSKDETLQENAAGTIGNIRKLALANDRC